MEDEKPKKIEKSKENEVAETQSEYKTSKNQKGVREIFDFDTEFAKGLTIEEARKLSKEKIKEWWVK